MRCDETDQAVGDGSLRLLHPVKTLLDRFDADLRPEPRASSCERGGDDPDDYLVDYQIFTPSRFVARQCGSKSVVQ